jgi:ABC-type dipeptide/oligopeptide/nickel transport system permease component
MTLYRLVALRILMIIPVAFGVFTLTFFVSHVLAADPVELFLPPQADEQLRQEIRASLGLDKPLLVQYGVFLLGITRGDLGRSIATGRPVVLDLVDRLPATFELATYALLLAILIGVPLGVVAAMGSDRVPDFLIRGVTLVGMALPAFWLGLIMIAFFFVHLAWLPGPVGRLPIGAEAPRQLTGLFTLDSLAEGNLALFWTSLRHLVLPALTLGFVTMAPITRVTRTAMVEALQSDYVRTAHAMGLSRAEVYYRYALKNALLPVVTMIGAAVGFLFSGAVLVENVFNWPGMGQYALSAIRQSDYAVLQGFVIWAAIAYVLAFLVVDLLYLVVDPRTR